MQPYEKGILNQSNYYIHTPSTQAKTMFFYPICLGHFFYSCEYKLHRKSYDSFLLMHIKKGECNVIVNDKTYTASSNQIVFLDCYQPHTYYTSVGWEAEWIHFDGLVARLYFQSITEGNNLILSLKDNYIFAQNFSRIYEGFQKSCPSKEALLSQYLTNMLTQLIIAKDLPSRSLSSLDMIEETTAYINEHICETLTLELLAERASLSPYYFTRLFKKETGFTPHEYIIASRINHAKFLLKNTNLTIKEICFLSGFANESGFCSTFKKWEQTTPSNYRLSMKL